MNYFLNLNHLQQKSSIFSFIIKAVSEELEESNLKFASKRVLCKRFIWQSPNPEMIFVFINLI